MNGSVPKVFWFSNPLCRAEPYWKEYLSIGLPFLTQYYFQTHLFLTAETCLFNFVQDYQGEDKIGLSSLRDVKPGSVELETLAKVVARLDLPTDEYAPAERKEIFRAIKLLRHMTIHRGELGDNDLWFAMKLPELLGDWHRTFEIQQVFMFVRDASAMESDARKAVDQLLFGPKTPPTTLLQAHTWLQHSLEELCFRFVQRNYPEMLKDSQWEWPEQGELQESWEDALVQIQSYDHSLDSNRCPNDESQLFSHQRLRRKVLLQGRNLRDAISHRDGLNEAFLRNHVKNGILLAIMVGDREQAIDIEATMEAFLTGRTKYEALTRLRAACRLGTPVPSEDLGERRKHEALASYLGDKEVHVGESRNQLHLQSANEDLAANTCSENPSPKAELNHCSARQPDSRSAEGGGSGRPISEMRLWNLAIGSFVFGDSIHEAFRYARWNC